MDRSLYKIEILWIRTRKFVIKEKWRGATTSSQLTLESEISFDVPSKKENVPLIYIT